jgi:FAD/FMN-containing dehydrogenase
LWIGIGLSYKHQQCVGGAVTGDAAGALVGHHPGKAQIVRRIKLVNPNQLVRSIRKPKNAIKELTGSLPGLLAAQNKELDALSFDREYGDNFSSAICKKLYRNSNKPHCIGRVPDTQRVTSELSQ